MARHTPYAGAANIDQGIVINLEKLPSPGLAADHKTITVSPSQTWDQVYETLQAFDLATLGGRVAGVGVGGLTTGCMFIRFYPDILVHAHTDQVAYHTSHRATASLVI